MKTYLRQARAIASQRVVPFTGEGAYHGSTKARARPKPVPARAPAPPVAEMRAHTLEALARGELDAVPHFDAHFPNLCEHVDQLPVPSQAEIREDAVTLCWCPLELALAQAGPLTTRVLERMSSRLRGHKRYVYIDSKIQYFEAGDLPVDSQHWHVDGSISARGAQVEALGHGVLHDMRARLQDPACSPSYLSYQSSVHCATLFATQPVQLSLPALIPNFDELDHRVRALAPASAPQPAGAIVRFDGLSLHRAVVAKDAGWRLWIRCVETDHRMELRSSIIECYGTVFRSRPRS